MFRICVQSKNNLDTIDWAHSGISNAFSSVRTDMRRWTVLRRPFDGASVSLMLSNEEINSKIKILIFFFLYFIEIIRIIAYVTTTTATIEFCFLCRLLSEFRSDRHWMRCTQFVYLQIPLSINFSFRPNEWDGKSEWHLLQNADSMHRYFRVAWILFYYTLSMQW